MHELSLIYINVIIQEHTTHLAPCGTTAAPYQFHIHTLLNVLSVFGLLLPFFILQKSLYHEALLLCTDVGRLAPNSRWTGRLNCGGRLLSLAFWL